MSTKPLNPQQVEDSVLVPTAHYDKLLSDLARYREAVGIAVAELESAIAGWQAYDEHKLADGAHDALAVLKGLEGGKGTQTST